MNDLISELKSIHDGLDSAAQKFEAADIVKPVQSLEDAANRVGKAWGHSWFGYQSRVYYEGLLPPPPGAHFSSEWGFRPFPGGGTRGGWAEFADGVVEKEIRKLAGNPSLSKARKESESLCEVFNRMRDDLISILRVARDRRKDSFLDKLFEEVEQQKLFTQSDFIAYLRPSGQLMSRDSLAISQGLWTPPHILILTEVMEINAPKMACVALAAIARRAFSHMERIEKQRIKADSIGTNVFIGHGRSKEWKDLKDFIEERMRLPWDEFNRVPVAGIPNTVRLSTMLDSAAIAFLVLTAEDEQADGSMQARVNVIHEAGLFQGRIGFARAIVMLEDGCAEFSNVAGLGQIRFPKNNIKAAFHDVQLVLERERLIEPPQS